MRGVGDQARACGRAVTGDPAVPTGWAGLQAEHGHTEGCDAGSLEGSVPPAVSSWP